MTEAWLELRHISEALHHFDFIEDLRTSILQIILVLHNIDYLGYFQNEFIRTEKRGRELIAFVYRWRITPDEDYISNKECVVYRNRNKHIESHVLSNILISKKENSIVPFDHVVIHYYNKDNPENMITRAHRIPKLLGDVIMNTSTLIKYIDKSRNELYLMKNSNLLPEDIFIRMMENRLDQVDIVYLSSVK